MSTKTVEERARDAYIDGFMRGLRGQTFREHVLTCKHCTVDPDGEVWACDEGAELRQSERKARL